MKSFFPLISLLFLFFFTGCTTTGANGNYYSCPTIVGQASGYYNPPAPDHNYHQVTMDASFNGRPVLAIPPKDFRESLELSREQQSWVKLSQQQQAQNHRESLDRARQQQAELRDTVYFIRSIARDLNSRRGILW